jgi:predicted nuclease with TOPRIM domain
LSNVRGINTSSSFVKQTSYDQSIYIDNKIRELESINKQVSQEKQKYEIEYKVLKDRYDDLIEKHSHLIKEYTSLKKTQTEVNLKDCRIWM